MINTKKLLTFALASLLSLGLLAACGGEENTSSPPSSLPPSSAPSAGSQSSSQADDTSPPEGGPAIADSVILEVNETSLLVYGELDGTGSLYTAGFGDAEITDASGETFDASIFQEGQRVEITFSGLVTMSYPGGLAAPSRFEITGMASGEILEKALETYDDYKTMFSFPATVYIVPQSGDDYSEKEVSVSAYPGLFDAWREANGLGSEVEFLSLALEDNATEETDEENSAVIYTMGTVAQIEIRVSDELKDALAEDGDGLLIGSLVKTTENWQMYSMYQELHLAIYAGDTLVYES